MDFLNKLGFNESDIEQINNKIPEKIKELLINNQKLVSINILYLKELGIENYINVFNTFYEMFLLDASTFKGIFDKYEREDLIAKISKNINIIEYL